MKQVLPHLRQVTVPNRGHAPYLEEPEALGAVDDFLRNLLLNLSPMSAAPVKSE